MLLILGSWAYMTGTDDVNIHLILGLPLGVVVRPKAQAT